MYAPDHSDQMGHKLIEWDLETFLGHRYLISRITHVSQNIYINSYTMSNISLLLEVSSSN